MFEIMTESTANLPDEFIEKNHIAVLSLLFTIEGKEYKSYDEESRVDLTEFYQMMREKKDVKTSLANGESAYQMGKKIVEQGKDFIYLGFSSGLSSTYQAVSLALEDLQEEFPERTIRAVDTLAAALGQGLLVNGVVKQREQGASLEEAYQWAMENRLKIRHDFTIDDLFFLKRGGRISAATAVVGSALSVKPILRVDDEGKLVPAGKARGRKKALSALVDRMEQHAIEPEIQEVFISHGDCLEDAEYVVEQIKKRLGVTKFLVHVLDPVIGAHSGPGTVALFYFGEHR